MAKDIGKGTVNEYVEDTRTGVSTLTGSHTTPVGTVSDLIGGSDSPRSESSTADGSIAGMPASQLPGNTSVAMTPQEIFDTYNVLAGQVQQYADANAMRAAQAQASYGPLAERVMGGSRTAGLGNYTYNRAIRPNLNSLTASLRAQGVSAALNRQLSEALNQAKNNYNSSYHRYSTRGGNNNNQNNNDNTGTGQTNINGSEDYEFDGNANAGFPAILYDTYDYYKGEDKKGSFTRPGNMSDMEWYKFSRSYISRLEGQGYTVRGGKSGN